MTSIRAFTRPWPARLALLAVLLLGAVLARAQDLQIIELKHRLAADLLPVVQPLVEQGGSITGTDNLLLVRTSAGNLAQIRQAVAALDRAPRQLLISVGQGNVGSDTAAGVRGSATIGSGDAQVGINRPPGPDGGVQVQGGARTLHTGSDNVGSVRTLEGSETFIAVGQSRPVTSTTVAPGWHGPTVTQTTEYREASSGFYATAHVNGDRVTLQISPQQQAFRSRGSLDTASLSTTVSGRLGEWIALGAVRSQQADSARGLLVWGTRASDSEYSAWVKVEEIP